MGFFYFVEILNHNGDLQARHKFNELPIRIGRSYSNDIILDDPHTAAEHAIIELNETGNIVLRDLGSQNGIKLKGKKHTQAKLNSDTTAQLGQTFIRVRDSHYVVNAEVSDTTNLHWQGWPILLSAIFIIGCLSLTDSWLDDIADNKISDYITTLIQWLVSAAAWAGIWALANRVFGGATNFNRHLFTLSCGLAGLDIYHYISTFFGFAFSWEWLILYKGHMIVIIALATIYYHLRLINPHNRALFKLLCVCAAIAISSLKLVSNYQSTDMYADELYMSESLPPIMRISRNHSLAEFDQSIQKLKAEVDAEREKALKEKAEKNKSIKK
jgi:pSer/pThr/pTyr-binding forkhead associated (FHA) protein